MDPKPERGRPRLKWKKCKTPEEKEAVRLYHKKYKKQLREKIRSVETPEEREARLQIMRAKSKECRIKNRSRELPEERDARRAKVAENQRKRMERKRATTAEAELREYNREHTKKFREKLYSTETPEQREARLKIIRDKAMEYRAKQRANETPEQTAERCARALESRKKRMLLKQTAKVSTEVKQQIKTEENDSAQHERPIEHKRTYRKRRIALKTPEQIAARLEATKEKSKEYRARKLALETPEERAARCARASERRRNNTIAKRAANVLETSELRFSGEGGISLNWEQWKSPEERETALRQYQMEYTKIYRSKKYASETPEQTAARLQKWKEKSRAYRTKRRDTETPEQTAKRLAKEAEQQRLRTLAKRSQAKSSIAAGETPLKVPVVKLEDVDGSFYGSWSSYGPSEGAFSLATSTNGGSFCISSKSDYPPALSEEITVVKNEASQDSWSYFKASESSITSRDTFQDEPNFKLKDDTHDFDKKSFLINYTPEREDFKPNNDSIPQEYYLFNDEAARDDLAYSEYIADKFRNCNRNTAEIDVAKNFIENIFLNLSTGAYNCITTASSSLSTSAPFTQAVIVKKEVDF